MQPTTIIRAIALSLTLAATNAAAQTAPAPAPAAEPVQMQHIRNATAKITYAGQTFLVDPLLAPKGAYPGFEGTFHSEQRNPLVDLPMTTEEVMAGVDAVIVTHTHLDHWDGGEHELVRKDIPLFVQHEADAAMVRGQGYTDVRILGVSTDFKGVSLTKIGGQHGNDEMYANDALGAALGEAMGVVFQAPRSPTVYFAGDTIWHSEVDQSLEQFVPDVIVLNTGEARMKGFTSSIIMSKDDVLHAAQAAPGATIVAVHMDAINHMTLSRADLRDYVGQNGIEDRVRIPADGEILTF
ncbi:MBL fold metallo-hydrolase [Brevundimonas naejangsanensis]